VHDFHLDLTWIEDLGHLGVLVHSSDRVQVSPGAARLLGVDDATTLAEALGRVDPAEAAVLLRLVEEGVEGPPCRLTLAAEGGVRTLRAAWRTEGATTRILLQDLTDTVRSQAARDALAQRLRLAEEAVGLGHWSWDVATGQVTWSDGTYRLHGYAPEEVEPTFENAMAAFLPEDQTHLQAAVDRALAEGTAYDLEIRLRRPDGTVRWGRARGQAHRAPSGEVTGLFGTLQEIHEDVARREPLRLLSEIVQHTREAILVTDRKGRITWVNPGFVCLSGYTLEEARGQTPGELLQGPGTDPTTVQAIRERLRAGLPYQGEILNYTKQGEPYWLYLSIQPRFDAQDQVIGFFAVEFDVTERREAEERQRQQQRALEDAVFRLQRQNAELERLIALRERAERQLKREIAERQALEDRLRQLALTDTLTGLPNRGHLFGRVRHEASRARRYGTSMAVLALDVDHFKRVNDSWGHSGGDKALQHVARVVGGTLREVDVLGRTGGEEFVVLLPETDADGARVVAERVRAALEAAPLQVEDGPSLSLTISLGVAVLEPGEDPEALLRRADQALYAAKEAGRNTWRLALPARAAA
jgi:diguanylate cyclase (GGDEF)-like protein/PAS domain S-box-containing protein